jgi:hypothetical protein
MQRPRLIFAKDRIVASIADDCKVSVVDLGGDFEVKELPKAFHDSPMADFVATVLVLLLIVALASIRQWPEWLRRARSANWPTTSGVVESGSVSTNRGRSSYTYRATEMASAKLGYSYGLDGAYHSGYHTETIDDEQKAWSYVDALKGQPVRVSYNPRKPEVSVLRQQQLLS